MFDITFDASSRTLNLVLSGAWDMAEFNRFEEDNSRSFTQIDQRGGPIYVLSDSREFPVQPADVANAFTRLRSRTPLMVAATAIVVGSVLNKMQASRTVGSDRVAFFMNLPEAREWLRQRMDSQQAA